jgi:carbamoyl-phosphate synthase large subunit
VARCLRDSSEFRGRIIGLGYETLEPGLYHRSLFDTSYLLPFPSVGGKAQVERLAEIHATEQFDAVIPNLDAELDNFIRYQPELSALGIRCLLPSSAQLRARAKDNLFTLCRELGLRAPKTTSVQDQSFFDRHQGDGWSYPLVVKGPYYDAAVVRNSKEAKAAFLRIAAQWGYPVLAQEFIDGHEVNLTAIGDSQGGLTAPVMMRKRGLTEKGKAWAGICVIDQELEQFALSLATGLRWSGPLEIEVLRGRDGKLYLLEINPRFPAWIYLSHGVGRNLPEMVLRCLAGEMIGQLEAPRPGTLFIRSAEELIVALDQYRSVVMEGTLAKEMLS